MLVINFQPFPNLDNKICESTVIFFDPKIKIYYKSAAPVIMEKIDDYLSNFGNVRMYKSSTFFLAQGVFRRKVKLDFTLGFSVKHLILISSDKVSKP